jgi:uncharacterized protein (DUF302 family)
MRIAEITRQINHVSAVVNSDFGKFTKAFESLAGKINVNDLAGIGKEPDKIKKYIESLEGFEGLMIFGITEHGALFQLVGQKRSARQYLVGNPLFAFSMTQLDIRTALYAPLKVLVYVNDKGATVVEYDRPSDQFGQFDNKEIKKVALGLDDKLSKLIAKAGE